MQILMENESADITTLSRQLGVSEMTVRRDLEILEKDGNVVRVYGGAKIKSKRVYESLMEERLIKNIAEKDAIAKKASEYIEDGDVIALDASTTALAICKYIKDRKKLTVITSNICAAIELSDQNDISIILLGGTVKKSSLTMVGPCIKDMLKQFYIDKAFICSKSLSFKEGLTDATIDEGEAKKAMMDSSKSVFIVADHTKINEVSFFHVCDYKRMNKIITDSLGEFTKDQIECLESFRSKGVDVVIAK